MNPVIPAILLIRVTSNRRVFPMMPPPALAPDVAIRGLVRGPARADTGEFSIPEQSAFAADRIVSRGDPPGAHRGWGAMVSRMALMAVRCAQMCMVLSVLGPSPARGTRPFRMVVLRPSPRVSGRAARGAENMQHAVRVAACSGTPRDPQRRGWCPKLGASSGHPSRRPRGGVRRSTAPPGRVRVGIRGSGTAGPHPL